MIVSTSMKRLVKKVVRRFKQISRKSWQNYAVLVVALAVFVGGAFSVWISTFKIPTLDSFEERRVIESTKIYDKTGEILLYDVNQDIKRTVIPLAEISRNIKNATIAIEDREFYEHNGIKPKSILRAILANLELFVGLSDSGYTQGGSTITQQVVKLSLLTSEKKISRKIKEWVLAVKLEKILSKDEILDLYLNEIPYGGSVYGIEEASQTFLGKSATDLTIAEAAYLASLPQAPTYYSPYGNHKDRLEERKNVVLKEMLRNSFITEEEYAAAKEEKIEFKPRETSNIKAPHFVFYVIEELEKKYGKEMVRDGGFRVITTLDYEMQKEGEEIIRPYALENEKTYNAENAAFVAIDPKTGGILTMIGSRDYFDKDIDGNFNITTAHRQPGSTFKPFVYAQAFEKGYTPETVLFDIKTQFSTNCGPHDLSNVSPCYAPDDYDGKYRGPMTMRESLAQSVNITSVKTLYLAGIKDSIRLAERFGIESLGDANQYGLTLVLGGGEVSPLEITSAYSVFANEGIRNPHTAILEVKDRGGNILEKLENKSTEVLPKETARKISSILSDNVARAPAFGESSFLHFSSRDVAVKTGTTNDYRDAWIIGYTPSVTLGAWAGNNDNSPMEKKVAGFIVAPMWRAFMDKILSKIPEESFTDPIKEESYDLKPVLRGRYEGGVSYQIDTVSGKLATPFTPKETTTEVLGGGVHSILHWLNKNDPRGLAPLNPANDPQYSHWEAGVSRWLSATGYIVTAPTNIPNESDDIHGVESTLEVTIQEPDAGESYKADEKISIIVKSKGDFPIEKIEYYLNGTYIGASNVSPFILSFIPEETPSIKKENTLRVIVYDRIFNSDEATTFFTVSLP